MTPTDRLIDRRTVKVITDTKFTAKAAYMEEQLAEVLLKVWAMETVVGCAQMYNNHVTCNLAL
jgi:hypothetical protein